MQDGLIEYKIQQSSVIRLNNKEEDFLCWNAKECRANDGSGRIGPYSGVDQIRVPWRGRDDCDLFSPKKHERGDQLCMSFIENIQQ